MVFFKTYHYQDLTTARVWLVTKQHATLPTFLIWNNLCDLVYQRPTRSYRNHTAVS